MRNGLKIAGIGLLTILVVMQFFQPERNTTALDPELDMLEVTVPPGQIVNLIQSACYDCHSIQTDYPWYAKISPLSWFLHKHIENGRENMNFSEYGQKGKAGKIGLLVDFCEVLDAGTMPLRGYMLLHKNARLSQEEKEILCTWTEEVAIKVMRE
jgi:Haem-binding domain